MKTRTQVVENPADGETGESGAEATNTEQEGDLTNTGDAARAGCSQQPSYCWWPPMDPRLFWGEDCHDLTSGSSSSDTSSSSSSSSESDDGHHKKHKRDKKKDKCHKRQKKCMRKMMHKFRHFGRPGPFGFHHHGRHRHGGFAPTNGRFDMTVGFSPPGMHGMGPNVNCFPPRCMNMFAGRGRGHGRCGGRGGRGGFMPPFAGCRFAGHPPPHMIGEYPPHRPPWLERKTKHKKKDKKHKKNRRENTNMRSDEVIHVDGSDGEQGCEQVA